MNTLLVVSIVIQIYDMGAKKKIETYPHTVIKKDEGF